MYKFFLYIRKGDTAAALKHFRIAAEHAVLYDSMPSVYDNSAGEYTSLLFKGVKFPFNMFNYTHTLAWHLLERSRGLDPVLSGPELEEIRNVLRRHTENK